MATVAVNRQVSQHGIPASARMPHKQAIDFNSGYQFGANFL